MTSLSSSSSNNNNNNNNNSVPEFKAPAPVVCSTCQRSCWFARRCANKTTVAMLVVENMALVKKGFYFVHPVPSLRDGRKHELKILHRLRDCDPGGVPKTQVADNSCWGNEKNVANCRTCSQASTLKDVEQILSKELHRVYTPKDA